VGSCTLLRCCQPAESIWAPYWNVKAFHTHKGHGSQLRQAEFLTTCRNDKHHNITILARHCIATTILKQLDACESIVQCLAVTVLKMWN
jgi:hypothetical protein